MKLGITTNKSLRQELLAQGLQDGIHIEWTTSIGPVAAADCYIDLLFDNSRERIAGLRALQPAIIIVNSVVDPSPDFIRINGWPGFLKRTVVEASVDDPSLKSPAERIFSGFRKSVEWIDNVPGFISPRIICSIINEAYFALEDGVSTRDEIDIAMKLGTNYPYGPFEWSRLIGLKNILSLLTVLSGTAERYQPAALLKKEALA